MYHILTLTLTLTPTPARRGGDTYTNDAGVKLAPGDEGHVAGAGYAHKGAR